jgi:hypothetical protein
MLLSKGGGRFGSSFDSPWHPRYAMGRTKNADPTKKMASLMNDKVSGLTSPSGKVVQFVAKRGEVGVFIALADQGYNMN